MKRNEIDEQFDQELRERAEREGAPIPEGYAGRVFQTCAGLEESSMKNQQRTKKSAWRWGRCGCGCIGGIGCGAESVSHCGGGHVGDLGAGKSGGNCHVP